MADFTRMYSKTLGVTMAEVAEERDYSKLSDWAMKIEAEINGLMRFEDDEMAQRKLKNAQRFMKLIRKRRTMLYREKKLAMGIAPESERDVFERSTAKCFMIVARQMLSCEMYERMEQMAKDMATRRREEYMQQRDDFMLND